jgi:hypothetical protein
MHSTGVYDRYFSGLTFQQQFDTEIMGVPVRGFYDATSRLLKSVRDSKTYHDEDITTFARQARYKFDYDLQCFIYTEAFGAKDFKFIAQSKKQPYTVGVFDASDEFYEFGKQKFIKAVEMLNVFFNADEPRDPNSYVYHGLV